jgi:STE24 endopeptidase
VASALAVAQAAVWALRPRSGLVAPAPVDVHEHFSEAEIGRARAYRRGQLAIFAASTAVETGALAALACGGGLRLPRRPAVAGAVLSAGLAAATLPFAAASRRRSMQVGLATQPWSGWAADVVKAQAIGAAMAAAGAGTAGALRRLFGPRWWAPGSALAVAAGAGLTTIGPVLLDPVFNRFTPLPDGDLRSDVLALARQAGVKVGEVYSVDASRRTTASNAYVNGLGPTKRVVLFDTLIADFAPEETRLVVAHELGHVRHRDVPASLLLLAVVAPPALRAAAVLAERWSGGDERRWLPALALAAGAVMAPIGVISNQLTRRIEERTDAFALRLVGPDGAEPFIGFHRGITVKNIGDPDPPRWLHVLLGTHPTAVQRIGIAKAYAEMSEPERRRSMEPQA